MNNEQLKTLIEDEHFIDAIRAHFLESKDKRYFMAVNTHIFFSYDERYPVIILDRHETDKFHLKHMLLEELKIAYSKILSGEMSIEQLIFSTPTLYSGYLKSHSLIEVPWEDPLIGFLLDTYKITYRNPLLEDRKVSIKATPLLSTIADNNIISGVYAHSYYKTEVSYASDIEFYQTEIEGKVFVFRENQYLTYYRDIIKDSCIYSYKSDEYDIALVIPDNGDWKIFDFKNWNLIVGNEEVKKHPKFYEILGNRICRGVYNYDFNENCSEEV